MGNSKFPKICTNPWWPQANTPGPMGINRDAADPCTPPWFVGNTPGPVGQNDYADPNTPMGQARAASYAVEQAPTLSNRGDQKLSAGALETMSTAKFAAMPDGATRKAWILRKLGPYEAQIRESAAAFKIPVQLLGVVVANELLDIDWKDVIQENFTGGSLGYAQIQVQTAIEHHLIPMDDGYRYAKALGMEQAFVAGRLTVPQYAIHGAAKEIRLILDNMKAHPDSAWVAKYGFSWDQAGDGQEIYRGFPDGDQREKEAHLAELVSAAYNSPDIVIAKNPFAYEKGPIHGANAGTLAAVFYIWSMFRP